MDELLAIFDVALLISTVRLVSPILLAALGGMFTERAGIFNIGPIATIARPSAATVPIFMKVLR